MWVMAIWGTWTLSFIANETKMLRAEEWSASIHLEDKQIIQYPALINGYVMVKYFVIKLS